MTKNLITKAAEVNAKREEATRRAAEADIRYHRNFPGGDTHRHVEGAGVLFLPEPNSGEVGDNNPSLPDRIWIDSWDAEYHLTPRDKDSVEYTRTNSDGGKEYVRGLEDAVQIAESFLRKPLGTYESFQESWRAIAAEIRALITQPKESQ